MGIPLIILLFGLGSIQDIDPEDFRWKNRLLILSDPEIKHPEDSSQFRLFFEQQDANSERDLLLIFLTKKEVWVGKDSAGDYAGLWRQHFRVPEAFSGIILAGKDGGIKLKSEEPVTPRSVYDLIDSMPMRQSEMKKKN